MKFHIATPGDGLCDGFEAYADSREEARKIIHDHLEALVGGKVVIMEYELVNNSTIIAMGEQRLTYMREDWENNWQFMWFDGDGIKDEFFFVWDDD